jgi:signal transduction histidine kinase
MNVHLPLSSDKIHHLKSPLTALRLGLDLLKKRIEKGEASKEDLLTLAKTLAERADLLGVRLEEFLTELKNEPPPMG